MGCETHGLIKGYIKHEDIFAYIKQNWDENAREDIQKHIICPLTQCKYYKLNEHSDDNANWYSFTGYIYFTYNRELRRLFYVYENVTETATEPETTYLSLGYNENSVEIIKALVEYFGGGWIDENTCDDKDYHLIENDFEREKTHMNEEKTQLLKTHLLKNYVDSLSYEVKELKTLLSNKDLEILESKKGKIQTDIDCAVANLEDIKRLLGEAGLYDKY